MFGVEVTEITQVTARGVWVIFPFSSNHPTHAHD